MKTLEEIVLNIKNICIENELHISCAESITGGLLSYTFTKVPGASKYFKGTIIAYNDEIKQSLLDIDPILIKKHSAVSKEVCFLMAQNIAERMKSDIGLSTTGYAGPNDGEKTGLVFMGIHIFGKTTTMQIKLTGSRNEIQQKTVTEIIVNLYEKLQSL